MSLRARADDAVVLVTPEDRDLAEQLRRCIRGTHARHRPHTTVVDVTEVEPSEITAPFTIVLVTTAASGSPAMDACLQAAIARHGIGALLPVVVDGPLTWDARSRSFEPPERVPAALQSAFADEPRHLDLSWVRGDPGGLEPDAPRGRDAAAELVATIRHVPKSDVIGEDLDRHRRVLRTARSATVVIAVLAVAASVAAVLARRSAAAAEQRRTRATATGVAEQARARALDEPDLAALLAVEGYRRDPTSATENALWTVGRVLAPARPAAWHLGTIVSASTNADGAVAVSGAEGLQLVDLSETGRERARVVMVDPAGRDSFVRLDATGRVWTYDPIRDELRSRSPSLDRAGDPVHLDLTDGILADLTADGAHALVATVDGRVLVLDTATGARVGDLARHDGVVTGVVASPDGRTLASTGVDGRLVIGPTVGPAEVESTSLDSGAGAGPAGAFVAWSADGSRVATLDGTGMVRVFSLTPLREVGRVALDLRGAVPTAITPFNGGRFVVTGPAHRVNVVDPDGRTSISTTIPSRGPILGVMAVDDSSDDAVVVGSDGSVHREDLSAPAVVGDATPVGHPMTIGGPVVDGRTAAAVLVRTGSGRAGRLGAWNLDARRLVGTVDTPLTTPGRTTMLRDGSTVASVDAVDPDGRGRVLAVVDTHRRRMIGAARLDPDWGDPRGLVADPQSDRVLVLTARALVAWPIDDRRLGDPRVVRRARTTSEFTNLAARHGLWAVRTRDGTVATFTSPGAPEPIARMVAPEDSFSMTFDHRGTVLAVGGPGTVDLFDPRTGKRLGRQLVDTSDDTGYARALVFSADDERLYVGSSDGSLHTWLVASGQQLGPGLTSNETTVYSAVLDDHTGRVVTTSGAPRVVSWNVDPEALARSLCRRADRTLTRAEWSAHLPDDPYDPSCRG